MIDITIGNDGEEICKLTAQRMLTELRAAHETAVNELSEAFDDGLIEQENYLLTMDIIEYAYQQAHRPLMRIITRD